MAKLRDLKTNAKDTCNRIGELVFRNKAGFIIQRLFVIGDDIEPYNFKQVMGAYSKRCRPKMDEWH